MRRAPAALLVCLALLAAACGDSSDDTTTSPPPGGGATGGGDTTEVSPGEGGGEQAAGACAAELTDAELVVGIASDVGSLDPHSLSGTGGGNWPSYDPIFGGGATLVTYDPETLEFEPGLADSWEVSEDNLAWTFQLNPDATFHNGEPVTAEDVKFSMDRQIGQAEYNPGYQAGYGAQFEPIVDRAEAIDEHTVVFHLKQPDVIFLLRPLWIMPKAYVEEVGDEGVARHPIGAGPFKFVSRIPDSEIVLERHEEFHHEFGSETGYHPSYVQRVVQRIIPEDSARLAALQAGEIDMAHNVSSDIARQLESDDQFVVHYLPGSQPMIIDINTEMQTDPTTGQPNPWLDRRVRVAANLAVDLDTIIETILTGREKPTYGSARAGFGFPADIEEQRFGYDPEEARRLLAEAGYPDGFRTTMVGPTGRWPNSRAVMEAVAQYLAEVGIEVEIQELQYQEVVTRVQERTLGPLIFWGRAGGPDPGANFRYNYHSESNFSNGPPSDITPEGDVTELIDTLIEQSEQQFDPEQRRATLEKIITEFYLSAKSIWLYEPVTVAVTTDDWAWSPRGLDLAFPEYWNICPVSS